MTTSGIIVRTPFFIFYFDFDIGTLLEETSWSGLLVVYFLTEQPLIDLADPDDTILKSYNSVTVFTKM